MRLGKPRIDGAVGQESEEGVAFNEDAPGRRVRKKLGDGGLAGARWTLTIKSEPITAFSPSLGTRRH